MFWVFMIIIYYAGAVATLRQLILHYKSKVGTSTNNSGWYIDRVYHWYHFIFPIIMCTLLWPLTVTLYTTWALMFPRGVITKEMKLKAKLKEAEERAKEEKRAYQEALAVLRDAGLEGGDGLVEAEVVEPPTIMATVDRQSAVEEVYRTLLQIAAQGDQLDARKKKAKQYLSGGEKWKSASR